MIITSTIPQLPGTVEMLDTWSFDQVLAFERALAEIRQSSDKRTAADKITIAGLLPILHNWQITGIPDSPTVETFPATPRRATAELIALLLDQAVKIYVGEIEIPNA